MIEANELKERTLEYDRVPEEVAILPSGDNVLYPTMVAPMSTADEKVVKVIDDVVAEEKIIGIFAQHQTDDMPDTDNTFAIGTSAVVARMQKMPDGSIMAFLQGQNRIRIKEITQTKPYLKAKIEPLEETVEKTPELEALSRNIIGLFQKMVSLAPNLPDELIEAITLIVEPGSLADFVAAHINLTLHDKQGILEELNVRKRLERVIGLANKEMEILELGSKIQTQMKDQMDKTQREFFLREQMKVIQRELGEVDERSAEINEFREKIEKAGLPPEALKEAERELDRLSKMPPQSADFGIIRTYLDWITSLPWNTSTEDTIDVVRAAEILDQDHYDLEKVKDRILDYLAVRKLKQDMKGPILCFVGPPGTGKTSIGKSIARALGRKFIRMSLGGIRDEAEIRGHRRTYVGALPGRIIQEIRRAGSNDPVFMLDEIDKIGADFRGDPSAALLEALDPEQNFSFSDHYLDVPFDLSKVMFITTANLEDPIIPALRDRMEIIELSGYTEREKVQIAKQFIVPKQLAENGITEDSMEISDEAVVLAVRNYTREAGLRNLEREIGTISRKVARRVAEGKTEKVTITDVDLRDILGPKKFHYEVADESDEVGVVTGLAWTQVGGEILFVEASLVPGTGRLTLTGKLGEVMQESAKAALTYTRARATSLGIDENFYQNRDIHIHIPAGAIPKDGPSAGVTLATALTSALSGKPVRKDIAMTGEITLRGRVMPVGGVKEKVLAAHRAGVKKVILPKENEKDLYDIPQQVRDELTFIFAEHIDDVLKEALSVGESLKKQRKAK